MVAAGESLMETATSTTTREILGLALLAVLGEKPSSRIDCAQAEFDALTGESREDKRDAIPFLPFST